MGLILNLETSTKVCSVAIAENGQLLSATETCDEHFSHAEKLSGFIETSLKKSGKQISDLNAVAISQGPGSYTGLRIGTSTAKGLCYALNIPLIAVNTLKSLCYNLEYTPPTNNTIFVPMLDARRMEVYTQLFNAEKEAITEISAQIIDENSFQNKLKNKLVFFGDGARKCKGTINHINAIFVDEILTSARGMIELSYQKFKQNQFEDVAYFEPFYLKEFVAGKPKKLV